LVEAAAQVERAVAEDLVGRDNTARSTVQIGDALAALVAGQIR